MDFCLVDERNIKKFLEKSGKFLFTDVNYKDYTKGHIVNSIHFPSACLRSASFNFSEICINDGMLPVQYIDDISIIRLFQNARLYKKDHICIYGGVDEDVYASIFVIYTLYKFGFTRLYYLNCNWKKLPQVYITLEFPMWKKCKDDIFTIKKISVDPDDMYDILQKNKHKLLDVRSPSDYAGETGVWAVKGHIPTAVNIFWKSLFVQSKNDKNETVPSQKLLDTKDLKRIFKEYFNEDDKIIVYCNTGSEGSVAVFILKLLFGWKNIKLFEKSFGSYQYLHQICPDYYPIMKN
jgi:3-mercaptopyruvate sulfurtransferase SseA